MRKKPVDKMPTSTATIKKGLFSPENVLSLTTWADEWYELVQRTTQDWETVIPSYNYRGCFRSR